MLTQELLFAILEQFRLPSRGVHGVTHWARVLENGRLLAARSAARLDVVELFAIFHDSRRFYEYDDDDHGLRGAELAAQLRGGLFDLPDEEFRLLQLACAQHTYGQIQADITVQACWDADRLDLNRVSIRPRPDRLCTLAARDPAVLAWANERAHQRAVPELVTQEWRLDPFEPLR